MNSEFEKWSAIRASVVSVGGMLAWFACQHGWHGLHASVDTVGDMLAWVAWMT